MAGNLFQNNIFMSIIQTYSSGGYIYNGDLRCKNECLECVVLVRMDAGLLEQLWVGIAITAGYWNIASTLCIIYWEGK